MNIEERLSRAIDAAEVEIETTDSNDPRDSRPAYATREQKIAGLIALLEDRIDSRRYPGLGVGGNLTAWEAYCRHVDGVYENDRFEAEVDRARDAAQEREIAELMDIGGLK